MFEYLGNFRPTKGVYGAKGHRERLHYWAKVGIQNKVPEMAHYRGMRIAPHQPERHKPASLRRVGCCDAEQQKDLATFPSGKTYQADLNAAYNIGARYFIKFLKKPLRKRIGCVWR